MSSVGYMLSGVRGLDYRNKLVISNKYTGIDLRSEFG